MSTGSPSALLLPSDDLQTLVVDPEDTHASIRAKVEALGAPLMEIVVPPGHRAFCKRVSLRLLRRYLVAVGVRAVVHSTDGRIRALARSEGLAVGAVVPRAYRPAVWAGPGVGRGPRVVRRTDTRALPKVWLGLAGIVLVGLLVAGAVLLPNATVTLRVASQEMNDVLTVSASVLAGSINVPQLTIPGRMFEDSFEVTATGQPVGENREVETRARGRVLFANRTAETLRLPAGARIATAAGVEFLTQNEVTLPAQPFFEIAVPIVAANLGVRGNVQAFEITRLLEPVLAAQVTVTNDQPTSGGADNKQPAVSEEDYRQLRAKAMDLARAEVRGKLEGQRGLDYSFYPEAIRLRITEEGIEPRIGQEATQASFRLQGQGRVVAFRGQDINDMLGRHLQRLHPSMELEPGSKTVQPLGLAESSNDVATFHVRLRATLRPVVDEAKVREAVAGKTPAVAEELLSEELALAGPPKVSLGAFWSDRVPVLPWQITVRTVGGR